MAIAKKQPERTPLGPGLSQIHSTHGAIALVFIASKDLGRVFAFAQWSAHVAAADDLEGQGLEATVCANFQVPLEGIRGMLHLQDLH